jgi:hypothetical protein
MSNVLNFQKDPSYGLNDWEPCVAFVRGILENTEDPSAFSLTKKNLMRDNSLFSQAFIERLGSLRDIRGVDLLKDKLNQLGPADVTFASPLFPAGKYIETLCLKALAKIGGTEARNIIEQYRTDTTKGYLASDLAHLTVAAQPRPVVPEYGDEFPPVLKNIRSIHSVLGLGGANKLYTPEQVEQILAAWRSLPFRGTIEYFSGDGHTTTFKPKTKIVDHVHDFLDTFCDFGIFRSNHKIEYPISKRRFADSHTYLNFQIADGSLYDKEYTWNLAENTIHTHFHEYAFEEAIVNPDGMSVTVLQKPISTGVEVRGNILTKQCTSGVRGIWDNPSKTGTNYYIRRANILTGYKQIYYFTPLHTPIVNQLGIWPVDEMEHPEQFFDIKGNCLDVDAVVDNLLIPLHEPKVLAWSLEQYAPEGPHDKFASRILPKLQSELTPVPPAQILDHAMGTRFEHSRCGSAGIFQNNINGYINGWDINSDSIIDEKDKAILAKHAGKVYRLNIGDYGYFGTNWLSIGNHPRSKNWDIYNDRILYICAYDYGAGYNSDAGTVQLFQKLPAGKKLYVEYFHDAPAACGKNNVKVYLHDDAS